MKRLFCSLKLFVLSCCVCCGAAVRAAAADADTAAKISAVKKGWNFGPLPAVGYNSDLGFQYGALCDVYYYGDGSAFPEYLHKFNVEASWYTKGSGIFHLFYDSKYLIPGIRVTFATTYMPNKMMSFYGFDGFSSPYSASIAAENPSYYAIDRKLLRIIADFQGRIDRFGWVAGVAFRDYRIDRVRLPKYADSESLYLHYLQHGVIAENQAHGGSVIELKLGAVFDTRDNEPAPNRGLCAEAILYGSPDIINRSGNSYLKLSLHFRHYLPIVYDRLTFAYHVAFQGTLAGDPPFYTLQEITTLYLRQVNSEGLGSINTVRGMLYNRAVGKGYVWANFELRYRLFDFRLFGQNWYLAANPFADAGIIAQPYNLTQLEAAGSTLFSGRKGGIHASAGIGLKAVMNRNFIISAEWGTPFDRNDGTDALNIGLNYIF